MRTTAHKMKIELILSKPVTIRHCSSLRCVGIRRHPTSSPRCEDSKQSFVIELIRLQLPRRSVGTVPDPTVRRRNRYTHIPLFLQSAADARDGCAVWHGRKTVCWSLSFRADSSPDSLGFTQI